MAILRNILALIVGLVIGGCVNMALIMLSGSIIPLPAGVNPEDIESIKANMHLYEAKHFIMPFLAHALGTFVGAVVAIKIAASYKTVFAYVIGGMFMIGGIMMAVDLPGPTWFEVADVVLAYLPMSCLALKLFKK